MIRTGETACSFSGKGYAMKWSRLAAAALVFLSMTLVGVAGTDNAKKIIGVWELVKGESPGSTVEFTRDGKLKVHAKVKDKEVNADGTYKIEGDKLKVTLTFKGKTILETNKIKKLTEKELILVDEEGKVEEFKRLVKK
jgi:uncharacterized protein (TIGR03066 family)